MIWLILLFGLVFRLISLNQSLWLDEGILAQGLMHNSFLSMVVSYPTVDFHPPGFFAIESLWTSVFGYSEIALRLPSVIFGVLTIYLVYLIGLRIFSDRTAQISALLLAINPLHLYYSQEARMYSFATLCVCLSIYTLLNLKKSLTSALVFILSMILLLGSDYVAYLIIPAELIYVTFAERPKIKYWFISLAVSLMVWIWFVPIFIAQLHTGNNLAVQVPGWKQVVGGFGFKPLALTFIKFTIGRISLDNKILYGLVSVSLVSVYGFLSIIFFKKSPSKDKWLLLSWLGIPIALGLIISIVTPIYDYFRVLFVLPAFILITASGLMQLRKKWQLFFLALVVLISLFCSGIYLLNPALHREDWKGLSNYLSEKYPQTPILLESNGNFAPLEYYENANLNIIGGLRNFPANNSDDVADLKSKLGQNKDVLLVNYLVDISDPQRLVAKKLNDLGYAQKDVYNFNGVGLVYLYER